MLFAYDLNHMKAQLIDFKSPLYALLPHAVLALCSFKLFNKGSRLFKTGRKPEWMFFVVSGEVTLERLSPQGDSVVLQRTRHGFVSEASLQSPKYHCDAVVIADAEIIQIPIQILADALSTDPAFAGRWINMLNNEVRRLRLHLERLNMKSVRDRLVHLIATEGKDGHLPIPSGVKTLANELGVTHEALYRTISTMQAEGTLKKENSHLVIQMRI